MCVVVRLLWFVAVADAYNALLVAVCCCCKRLLFVSMCCVGVVVVCRLVLLIAVCFVVCYLCLVAVVG